MIVASFIDDKGLADTRGIDGLVISTSCNCGFFLLTTLVINLCSLEGWDWLAPKTPVNILLWLHFIVKYTGSNEATTRGCGRNHKTNSKS